MSLARRAPLLLALSTALVAGCGGDSDEPDKPAAPSPQEQVRAAAQNVITERDASVLCRRLVTQAFVEEVFDGDAAACADSELADAPPNGQQVVGDIQVTGPKASVEIVQRGGDHDGLGGHYAFVREGDAWKLDRFEDDVVRASLVVSAGAAGDAGDSSAFSYPPLRDCVTERFESMPMKQARGFLFAVLNKEPQARKLGNNLLKGCPRELAGYVADRLANGLGEGRSEEYVDCMRREMETLLFVTGLSAKALKGNTNGANTAALSGIALAADKECRKLDPDGAKSS